VIEGRFEWSPKRLERVADEHRDRALAYAEKTLRENPDASGEAESLADAIIQATYEQQRGSIWNEAAAETAKHKREGDLSWAPDSLQRQLEDEGLHVLRRRQGRFPDDWEMIGFIRSMRFAWEALGLHAGRVGRKAARSRFQDFMWGWLWELDPTLTTEQLPSSEQIKKALKRYRSKPPK